MAAVKSVRQNDVKHTKIISLLLNHPRIDVNKQNDVGRSALHASCEFQVKSHIGAQLLLSDERYDVNLQTKHGATALMTSLMNVEREDDDHAVITALLLSHPRIDVHKQDKVGWGAVHVACGAYGIKSHLGAQLLGHKRIHLARRFGLMYHLYVS